MDIKAGLIFWVKSSLFLNKQTQTLKQSWLSQKIHFLISRKSEPMLRLKVTVWACHPTFLSLYMNVSIYMEYAEDKMKCAFWQNIVKHIGFLDGYIYWMSLFTNYQMWIHINIYIYICIFIKPLKGMKFFWKHKKNKFLGKFDMGNSFLICKLILQMQIE